MCACWGRRGARVLLCVRGHAAAGAANKGSEQGRATGSRVCVQLGLGCCQGTGIGELRILVVVVLDCVLVWGNTKFSHSSPFLLCFNVLQCVLLLGLAHLPQHLPPLCSAARSPAGLPLSLLSHPPSSSSATPTSARPSAAEGLPRPCTRLLTGARDFGC